MRTFWLWAILASAHLLGAEIEVLGVKTADRKEAPIAGVYIDLGRAPFGEKTSLKVILLVWGDGRLLWSKDRLFGGPPYFEGKIEKEQIVSLAKKLGQEKLLDPAAIRRQYMYADSKHVFMFLAKGVQAMTMVSGHPLVERDGEYIETPDGGQKLEGKTLSAALAEQPAEYKEFRKQWDAAMKLLLSIIPSEGDEKKSVDFSSHVVRVKNTVHDASAPAGGPDAPESGSRSDKTSVE